MSKCFFFAYRMPSEQELKKRNSELEKKGAQVVDLGNSGIEAVFLPAAKKTDQIILFAFHKPYQKLFPSNYDHYKESADVVFWNPTKCTGKQYERDLQQVVEKIRSLHPHKKIAIIGRCATVDPAISVAHRLNDPKISLILDRGHGNISKLARSFTIFSKLPCIAKILQNQFDCEGEKKIGEIPGKILFTVPKRDEDQVMCYGRKKNLTYDLIEKRKNAEDQVVVLPKSGHWTTWSSATHEKIHRFLEIEAPTTHFPKNPAPPTFFKRNVFPYLIKSWL